MRTARVALFLLLVSPAAARAGTATIASRDLPVGVMRTTAAAVAPARFDLVAFHWQGRGHVLFRTRSQAGRWSGWRAAAPEAEDLPDLRAAEGRGTRGWRLGSPYWVGPSDRVSYRVAGEVRRLRVFYVWSPVEGSRLRHVSMAGSPQMVSRAAWRADDEILRGSPRYAKAVSFAVVHHTAGTNSYGPAASAAIVRGIQLYHVRGNGWNDIGYNFLVDRYGQVFEGRIGGVDRNVVGAHAQGFNTGSVGVAVIGNYSARTVSPATEHALARLLAWRLDVAHVDPLGRVGWRSGGNPRYPRGTRILLRAISGHRDTGFTSCPGTSLYVRIPDLAREVAAIGLPKLYVPLVRGSVGGPVEFTARLSSPRPWAVTVRSAAGAVVVRGTGSGSAVAWTWSSAGVSPGRYTWTIEAGLATRPAQGTIGIAPPPPPPRPPPPPPRPPPPAPLLSALTLDPSVLSPDGDGVADVTTISYTLTARSAVTVSVTDASGTVVASLLSAQLQGVRRQSFPYRPDALPDGAYTLTISASALDGRAASVSASFLVDRTLSALTLTTTTLTPNGDGSGDTIGIAFTLAAPAEATVQIEQAGTVVASVFAGPLPAGAAQVAWDGSAAAGPAPGGAYDAVVIVRGPFGETRHALLFTIVR